MGLKLLWYGFMLTAVLLAPLAVLLGQVLAGDGLAIVPTGTVVGLLAAVVQFLGLARWPFLVPGLARAYIDPARLSWALKESNLPLPPCKGYEEESSASENPEEPRSDDEKE